MITPDTNCVTYYFAATATDANGLESDYSNEASTNYYGTSLWNTVVLAWDRPGCTNVITNYTVFQGTAHATYTNSARAGTNLTAAIRVIPAAPTNLVVTVSCVTTNLRPLVLTNPPYTIYGAVAAQNGNKWVARYEAKTGIKGAWQLFSSPAWTNSSKPNPSSLRVTVRTNWQ